MKRLILAVFLVFALIAPASAVVKFTNNATSLVADVGGISDVDTTVTVTTGEGALFPDPTSPDYFMATLVDVSGNREIVKVTARSSDALTIDRAEEGTSARSFAQGSIISHRLTAGVLDEFGQIRSVSSYFGMASAVASIGATVTSIYCKSTQTIADNLVVPATLTILAFQECSLEPAGGKTLTMNSTPLAGDYEITGGAGTVTFAATGITYSSWTGGTAGEIIIAGAYTLPAADGSANQFLATDGSGNIDFASGNTFTNKTTDYPLTAADCNGLITFGNDAAGARVIFTLPTGASGLKCGPFIVVDNKDLQLKGSNAEKLRYLAVQTAANGYVETDVVGNSVSALWTGDDWNIFRIIGTWDYDQ